MIGHELLEANAVVDRVFAPRRTLFQKSCTSMKFMASSSTATDALPSSDPLALVGLPLLMQRTGGRSDITVALIDGPVMPHHPGLVAANIHAVGRVDRAQRENQQRAPWTRVRQLDEKCGLRLYRFGDIVACGIVRSQSYALRLPG